MCPGRRSLPSVQTAVSRVDAVGIGVRVVPKPVEHTARVSKIDIGFCFVLDDTCRVNFVGLEMTSGSTAIGGFGGGIGKVPTIASTITSPRLHTSPETVVPWPSSRSGAMYDRVLKFVTNNNNTTTTQQQDETKRRT